MRKFSPVKILRLLLATLLSLWVAGAGCILGCEGMIASAADGGSFQSAHYPEGESIVVASGHACSSGKTKSHDCCKKGAANVRTAAPAKNVRTAAPAKNVRTAAPAKNSESLLELSGSPSGAMNGCPLAVNRASVVAKTRESDLNSAAALAQSILPDMYSAERTAPLSTPLRLPNRGHTYLRCCVFLI